MEEQDDINEGDTRRMRAEHLILVALYTSLLAAMVGYNIYRARKRRRDGPAAHRGEHQSQRGRAYKEGVSWRSSAGEGYEGPGENLKPRFPEYRDMDHRGRVTAPDPDKNPR